MQRHSRAITLAAVAAMALVAVPGQVAQAASHTYTTDSDFAEGTANNVVTSTPNQLQLDDTTTAFPFIWVALSARGTIAKIDTVTGEVLGEYSTTSDGDDAHNPSRTTVANDGSVWAGNRNQSSVIHVGNLEAGGCVDRDGSGTIETSSGYGDVLPWPGGSSGASAPVTDAEDECILHYVDTAPNGYDARHLSVNADGDVWVGAYATAVWGQHEFQLLDGTTGAILRTEILPCGGYGGLIDGNGVLWSSTSGDLLRWDPTQPVSTAQCLPLGIYGLAFDSTNHVWASTWSGIVYKVAPDGASWQSFPQGHPYAQGLAVDGNDHVWISSSLSGGANSISHLLNDGTLIGQVTGAGSGSTGVSVDAAGKIWTANIDSSDATRIDPTAGGPGSDGVTPLGAFDLTVPLPEAYPYNYSDMTGSTLSGAPTAGTWTVVHDSGEADAEWGTVDWTADVPGDSALTVKVASSTDGVTFSSEENVTAGADLTVPNGQYLRIVVAFTRATTGESPILYDLTVATAAEACTALPAFKRPFDPSTADNLVVNTIKNGRVAPIKVALTDTCTGMPVAPDAAVTIAVTRVAGEPGSTPDPVEVYADAGQSSAGTDAFRLADGFWIYNLDTRGLGLTVGNTYRVDVFVDGILATADTWLLIQPVR